MKGLYLYEKLRQGSIVNFSSISNLVYFAKIFLVAVFILCLSYSTVFSATRVVGDCVPSIGVQYQTIQSAVTAAQDGDVIIVCPGTYNESVNVSKDNLIIKGYDGHSPENIVVKNKQIVFILNASNITLKNMKISSKKNMGIYGYWEGTGEHVFENLKIDSEKDGIRIRHGDKQVFRDINITSKNGYGIYLDWNTQGKHEFDNLTITSKKTCIFSNYGGVLFKNLNLTSNNGGGIDFDNSEDNVTFTDINIISSDIGIHAGYGVEGNHILKNLDINSIGGNGIYFENGFSKLAESKITAENIGVVLVPDRDLEISSIEVQTNSGNGIQINWSSDPRNITIKDSYITAGGDGIYTNNSDSILMDNLTIDRAKRGIYLPWNMKNITVQNSVIKNTSDYGLYLDANFSPPANILNNCFYGDHEVRVQNNGHNFSGNYYDGVTDTNRNECIDKDDSPKLSGPIIDCNYKTSCEICNYGSDYTITPLEAEGGTITLNDTFNNREWNHITFQKPFSSIPVVFVVANNVGGEPASIRIKNVTTTGFDITIVEPPGRDGPHVSQTLSYIAMNKGVHRLGGHLFEVGTVDTKKVQGKYVNPSNDIGWVDLNTSINFCNPVAVANIQTLNNLKNNSNPPNSPLIPWSTAVIDNNGSTIRLALDMSETSEGIITNDETIGYMIAEGNIQGSFFDDNNTNILFETIKTDPYFVGWDDSCKTVNFVNHYSQTPIIAGWKNTRIGDNGGWFRICKLNSSEIGFVVDEDTDYDTERNHVPEVGGIFVFSNNFVVRENNINIPDHYEIIHDGVGLTCQPEKVSIKACSDNSTPCTEYTSETTVTLNYNSTSVDYTFTGSTNADVIHQTPGSVTLSLSNMNPEAENGYICYNTVNGSNSCNIEFFDSGFVFDIEDTYSCKPQTVTIKAVRKDDETQKCIPAFENTTLPIDFTFNYVNPDANSANTKPKVNNTPLDATIDLTFDSNGESSFEFQYPDAGQIGISVSFDNGTVKAVGSDNATFYPYGFYVYTTTPNWQADNGANSTVFKKAGELFNLSAAAKCWQIDNDTDLSDNNKTPNYQRGNISVARHLIEPSNGNLGSIGITSLNFTDGTVSTDNQTFSEVGIIRFEVTDNSYFGYSITGTSKNIGRFIPDHFIIDNISNGTLANKNVTFNYIGQTTTYENGLEPRFTIKAVNKDNQTTTNYRDNFFKLEADGISLNYPTTDNVTKGNDNNFLPITFNKGGLSLAKYNGTGEIIFGEDNITYDRNENTLVNPFTPKFYINISSANDGDLETSFVDKRVEINGDKMYFGRLNISNSYGSELDNLTVDIYTEYYESGIWKIIKDNVTSIQGTYFDLDNFTDNLESGETSIIGNMGISEGGGYVVLEAPGEENYGNVDLILNNNAPYYNWLYDIIDNGSIGTATFGIYRGRDRIIDWQEVPAR